MTTLEDIEQQKAAVRDDAPAHVESWICDECLRRRTQRERYVRRSLSLCALCAHTTKGQAP